MFGIGALAQLALAEFPGKQLIIISSIQESISLVDITNATVIPPPPPSGHICVQYISPPISLGDGAVAQPPCIEIVQIPPSGHICVTNFSPPISAGQSAVAQIPCVALVQAVVDTHDGGFVKKKKKKKIKTFEDELERTAKIRKQITEVIHPPVLVPVEEPEAPVVPEVVETKPFEVKTATTPAVDYAGLARQEIVDKIRLDAEAKQREFLHQLELKRLADIEDEDELEMILEALL